MNESAEGTTNDVKVGLVPPIETAAGDMVAAYAERLEATLSGVTLEAISNRDQVGTPYVFMPKHPFLALLDLVEEVHDAESAMTWIRSQPEVSEVLEKYGVGLEIMTHWTDKTQRPTGVKIVCR